MAKVETPLAPRLVTAVDIAVSRLDPRSDLGLSAGIARSSSYAVEVRKAKDELARGEWVMPDEDSQIAAPRANTLAGNAQPDRSSLAVMSGGAEPAGAAKQSHRGTSG